MAKKAGRQTKKDSNQLIIEKLDDLIKAAREANELNQRLQSIVIAMAALSVFFFAMVNFQKDWLFQVILFIMLTFFFWVSRIGYQPVENKRSKSNLFQRLRRRLRNHVSKIIPDSGQRAR